VSAPHGYGVVIEAVEKFRQDGFIVANGRAGLDKVPDDVRRVLRKFDVDFIAVRREEIVVIQVLNRSNAHNSSTDELVAALAPYKNVALEVFWLGKTADELPDEYKLVDIAQDGLTIAEKYPEAGFYVCWIAMEGALLHLSVRNGVSLDRNGLPSLATLFSRGLILSITYDRLQYAWNLRNDLAHSGRQLSPEVHSLTEYVGRLAISIASRQFQTADVAIEAIAATFAREDVKTMAHWPEWDPDWRLMKEVQSVVPDMDLLEIAELARAALDLAPEGDD
jgi:hypothetical protein